MKLLVVSDVHGDLDALERAVDAEADAALYGHTHCAGCEERSGVVLFNPGALSRVQGRGSYGVVMVENGAPRFEHRRV